MWISKTRDAIIFARPRFVERRRIKSLIKYLSERWIFYPPSVCAVCKCFDYVDGFGSDNWVKRILCAFV